MKGVAIKEEKMSEEMRKKMENEENPAEKYQKQ